jgi:hypothetical protein
MLALLLAAVTVVETPHYRLHAEGSGEQAEEFGRVLEAAYAGFQKFFSAAPKLKRGEKLTVRYFLTREAWGKAILADRAVPPAQAGGYYWPASKTSYLYRQPTRLYTRTLLIHEAAHQFHYLARTGNNHPSQYWYTEGAAEFLAAHYWDGETLQLGVLPHVTLKDYAAAALQEAKRPGFRLDDAVSGKAAVSRPLGWAIYRFVATDGFKGFAGWAKKMDRGGAAGPLFARAFGRGKKLEARFTAWLEKHQQPFRQIFNEWQSTGVRGLRGLAGVVSACQLKRDAKELSATIVPPKQGRWKAGMLLGHAGPGDYVVALLDGKRLYVDRRVEKGWQELARREATGTRLRAFRRDGRVVLEIDGAEAGSWELAGSRFGLAIDNCDVRFENVSWKR